MTAGEAPGDAQQLREEIERTREDLGTTVEQLVAKADVKGRAQARAAELARQVTWQARSVMAQAPKLAAQAGKQATGRAESARGTLAATTAGARRKATDAGQAVPGPVREASAKGASAARKHWVPLSAAVGAGLLSAAAFIVWQRRKR